MFYKSLIRLKTVVKKQILKKEFFKNHKIETNKQEIGILGQICLSQKLNSFKSLMK